MKAPALPRRRVVRVLLAVLAVAGAAVPLLTLRRIPTPFPDVQLYASIALARRLYGVGVPTVTWNSPNAVDHIPFYGPVFFDLSALALRLFGIRLLSFRLVSVLGTGLYLLGALLLVRQFTRSRDRMLLAAVLVLLTPEVNFAMTAGSMHLLAVGFETLALAAFVKDFDRRRRGVRDGATAGIWLALAAMTTPRSYPFVFAFVCAGLVPVVFGTADRAVRYRLAAASTVLTVAMSVWAITSHGSVAAWVRYLAFIFMHEDTDVAVLPTAVRDLSFHWSGLLTTGSAIGFGLFAAWSLRRRSRSSLAGEIAGEQASRNGALSFLIACAWIDLIATAVLLNHTLLNGDYITLPLFAVVVAWPWDAFALPRRHVAILMGTVVVLQLAVLGHRYACLAATWEAHDPDAVNAFVARYVPAGSVVVGPEAPFLFAVERSGSRYRTVRPRSWADWARWVPIVEPGALALARHLPQPVPRDRFLFWRQDENLPKEYQCATRSTVAHFEPAAIDRRWPDWIIRTSRPYAGYPAATLYRLPEGCPTGYDPTRPPR